MYKVKIISDNNKNSKRLKILIKKNINEKKINIKNLIIVIGGD